MTGSTAASAGPNNAPPSAVSAQGFGFSYDGHEPVLRQLDWTVPEGAFVVLSGNTGSGKSTLLRCMKRELAPVGTRQGNLQVLGQDVAQAAGNSAASVGFVSQDPESQMVCDTVISELAFGLENLGTPPDTMRLRVAEVAHYLGMEPWVGTPVAQLSGGQKQLLALASVLAMYPRLLLLDEPTAQLDAQASADLLSVLFRLNRELGLTVVLATHSPEAVASYATSHYRLEDGQLCGRPLQTLPSVSASRVRPPRTPPVQGAPAAVRLSEASFRYDAGGRWVLRGLNLRVPMGAIHAVVGGNACGKSTLLGVVAGTHKLQHGRLENSLASRQAFLPQDPRALLVCDSVLEELVEWKSTCGYGDTAVQDALERFSLHGLEARHPFDLSGGQRQLLALAKLWLTGPRLLIADEPTRGLDSQTRCLLAAELERMSAEGTTVLMATHDLPFARQVATGVSLMFDGQMAATLDTNAFFADNLFYVAPEDEFTRLWENMDEGIRSC